MTEEKTVEDRLRESQHYNRSIIEACPAALIVVNPRGGLTDVNEATVRFLGRPRADLVGSPLGSYFQIPPEAAASMREAFEGNSPATFELVLKASGTDERVVPFEVSMFHEPDGELRGLLVAEVA